MRSPFAPRSVSANEETGVRSSESLADHILAKCILSMMVAYIAALSGLRAVTRRALRSQRLQRRLVCFAILFNLLLWQGPGLFTKRAIAATLLVAKTVEARVSRIVRSDEAYLLASLVSESTNRNSLYVSPNSAAILASMFLQSSSPPHHQTMEERAAAVAKIRLSPMKFVGYQDGGAAFSAIATDLQGRTVHGVKFTYASSDESKLQIDETGHAKFLQPGLARVICRAGTTEVTAPVFIRPGHRPLQNDLQWRADQALLAVDGTIRGDSGLSSSDGAVASSARTSGPSVLDSLSSVLNKLSPTVEAQSLGYSDLAYDQLWNDPSNLVGSPRNRAIEPMRLGSVLPEGSNFDLAIPIISLGGRGLAASLILYYNSRVWSRRDSRMAYDAIAGWPSPGFSLGFGRLIFYDRGGGNTAFMWVEADGTRHFLGNGTYYGYGYALGATIESTDGSHIVYTGNASDGGDLYYPDGTHLTIRVVNNRLVPTMINDRNGNYIQIAYKTDDLVECCGTGCWCDVWYPPLCLDYVVDTLGRMITFDYYIDSNGTPNGLRLISGPPGFSGGPLTKLAQFYYTPLTVSGSFSGLTVERGATAWGVLNRLYFPATGTGYLFSYSGFGMISSSSLRRQMSIDFLGNLLNGVESASASFNYPQSGTLTDAPAFTQRTETAVNAPDAVWSYAGPDSNYLQSAVTFAITQPAVGSPPSSSTLYLSRSTEASSPANGLLVQSELKKGSSSFAKTKLTYVNDGGGSPQMQSVTSFDDTGTQTKSDFDYDQYGNVTNKREYGYQINGSWQVRRRTHYTYNTDPAYLNNSGAYLRHLVTLVEVFDAGQDTNDNNDVLIAKTSYQYDGGNSGCGSTCPPGYLSWYNSVIIRGNVSGITQLTDIAAGTTIQRSATYDAFGNVKTATVSCCQEKQITFTQNTYWSEAESVMSGDPNGTHTTTYTDYDFNTSLPKSATDVGGLTTTYGYDGALNPNYAALPTGATATAGYNYGNLSRTSTVQYDDGGVTKTITISEQYDGWGRVIQSVDGNTGQANTTYDAMGRVASRTNPFPAGGTPGPATTFQYDALGRATITTLPDGNTVQNTYSGSIVTATDQVGRKIKREVDGLGRLVKVTEQDVSTGLLTQETTYSYNLLNKLTGVNQGGQLRSYKYDAMGRLLYERIPEQNATIDDGTGTMWSCKYTYTEFGGVANKTDARGVVTTFTYDALHHVTQKSYDTSGAPEVAATSPVTFGYTSWGALLSVTAGAYNEYTAFDVYNRPNSVTGTIDGRDYTTSYAYNGASQVTWMAYPSGYVTGVSYDDRGRLSSEGAYLSGMSYNIAGQVTGLTLGNGVVESYSYDTNRMQLTMQTATKSGNQLMNLTYGYQAQAGQMGALTTAGNAGQLMAINNNSTINGTTESANYTYDDLARLVTSAQTSNGASVQRRFDCDRWGNRTAVWDATTGGNQIQSVAVEQSGGAPTNRIQSVSGVARTNVALATNGATATASSSFSDAYPASAVINGDRRGVNWGNGGGWNDANSDFPDWLQVSFNGSKTINEIDVFTLQDNYSNPSEPTETMTFSQFGVTDFQVQYWNGSTWQTVPGGSVTGNNKVWRKFTFSNITTDKIRVHITGALASYSRLTEIEAYSNTNNRAYDPAGNITNDGAHSYTYDAENRLVSVDGGATAQYWYDHQNRRVKKVVASSVTHYIWEGSQVIAEHDGNTPVGGSCDRPYGERSSLVDYVYLGSRLISSRHYTHNCGTTWQWCEGVGYVQQAVTCSTDRYYLSDRLSVRLILDGSGNVIGRQGHLPFGEDFAESGSQEKHHFTSYERDGESGADYAVNRQTQSLLGRFGQTDKVSGNTELPQSLNRYSYGRNDPINTKDPLGLFIFDCSGNNRLFPFGVTFFLDGIEIPNIFCVIIPIVLIIIDLPETERHPFPGFSDSQLRDISQAKEGAAKLLDAKLDKSTCADNLKAMASKRGRHIDPVALLEALRNTFVKPLRDGTGRLTDPSIHDSIFGHEYNVFNGSRSDIPQIRNRRGRDVGQVDLDGIFLYDEFFTSRATNPSARIGLDLTRAIAFLHEVIHTLGFDDDDFGTDPTWGLQDFIIQSCVNKNYDHNDTSF